MNKISPSNPGILSNNLEKGGMDFLEAVRKGGNDERAEGFPIQNLQPLVKLRLWTASRPFYIQLVNARPAQAIQPTAMCA